MSAPLQRLGGSLAILDQRVRALDQCGLCIWTDAAREALHEEQRRRCQAVQAFHATLAELHVDAHATKAELFAVIERANARLRGLVETGMLSALALLLTAAVFAAGAGDEDDDLARRASRGPRGRRRDDVVALCDAETGEDLS